ncbi:MAG: hypothetical protein NC299_18590 [Lachnospiraceae bacterium]|nr:hypothetical protein [Lachnospiraceae bacterium]
MKGMTVGDFIDKVYRGSEIEFVLSNTTYFVQGFCEDGKYVLTVDYWQKTDGSEPEHDYLLSVECDDPAERTAMFENAKIFNGKTIYEVESEIEVLYG